MLIEKVGALGRFFGEAQLRLQRHWTLLAFREMQRATSRSSLFQSALLQGIFEHSSSELYRLKKRLVRYSHKNPAVPFGLLIFFFCGY